MNIYYEVALFILQKVSCLLSSIGSLMIISQVIRSSLNRSKPQQRLVLGLSISDVVLSMTWIFTPLFMPPESGQIWAVGNLTTCNVQGFIITLFCAAGVLYQVTLQLQYLLAIKYGWRERRVRRIELYLHAFPWGCGLASAITNLILKNYNPANWDCWIAPYPSACTSTHEINQGGTGLTETDCIRGDNANIYQWAFFFAPLWACILFCLSVMLQVYRSVHKSEKRSSRFSFNSDDLNRSMRLSHEFRNQSFMYAYAFFSIWTFPSAARMIQLCGGSVHPVIVVLAGALIGAQGIWNAIIYFRPRYKKLSQDLNACQKILSLVNSTLFFWVCRSKENNFKDNKDCVNYDVEAKNEARGESIVNERSSRIIEISAVELVSLDVLDGTILSLGSTGKTGESTRRHSLFGIHGSKAETRGIEFDSLELDDKTIALGSIGKTGEPTRRHSLSGIHGSKAEKRGIENYSWELDDTTTTCGSTGKTGESTRRHSLFGIHGSKANKRGIEFDSLKLDDTTMSLVQPDDIVSVAYMDPKPKREASKKFLGVR